MFGLVECVFVGGVIGNSSVDGCWYLFYDVGRLDFVLMYCGWSFGFL